jgi:REP element-mobilizing transposase RayT
MNVPSLNIRKIPLLPERYYHIYNREINGQAVFFEEENYKYFLQLYEKYLSTLVETYAYCLLQNHFHILIRVRDEDKFREIKPSSGREPGWHVSNGFASLFQAYTRAINKRYQRTGALFETPFKRIEVKDNSYLSALIAYIHKNPDKHKVGKDFKTYKHSSYRSIISNGSTKLERGKVLDWFGGREEFIKFHEEYEIGENTNTFE